MDNNTIGGPARGFFVSYDDAIFVAAQSKSQLLVWSKESSSPIRSITADLFDYTPLFVTMNGDIYFENGIENGRIDKLATNSANSVFVTKFSGDCFGLFVHISNTLYCSIREKNKVVKLSLDDTNATEIIVAGTGPASNELSRPWGIFVDTNFDLYVAENLNHQIQLFRQGDLNGEKVAGNGKPQGLFLNSPTDVILDAEGLLYVADNKHDRVIRLQYDSFQCVVGCSGRKGSGPNELRNAYSIRFDSHGNLYVADEGQSSYSKVHSSNNFLW